MLLILYVIIDYFIIPLNALASAIDRYSFLQLLEKTAAKLHGLLFLTLYYTHANNGGSEMIEEQDGEGGDRV